MRAPSCAEPFTTAMALLARFRSDFWRLTSCEEPKEFDAGRFSTDIISCIEAQTWKSALVQLFFALPGGKFSVN